MKILVVLSRVPWPLEKGDKLRAYHLIREWSKNHEVVLFCLTDKPIDPLAEKKLNEICSKVLIHRLSKWGILLRLALNFLDHKPFQVAYFNSRSARTKFNRFLDQNIPDHIFCQLTRTAEFVLPYSVLAKSLDYMDAFSVGMKRMANKAFFPTKLLMNVEAKRLKNYETAIQYHFQGKFIISDQDKQQLDHVRDLKVIANGIDPIFLTNFTETSNKKIDILFTGNMAYRPNIESAKLLINNVMPLVWGKLPDINVCLAGATPANEVKSLASGRVTITGWVPDIASFYRSSKIFVAPMVVNTGLQNKLLEAMACKVPCITTSMANNALEATPDKEVLIADDADSISESIITLLQNEQQQLELAKAGQQYVVSKFNWADIANQFLAHFHR